MPLSLTGHDPAAYERHLLHAPTRSYPETNCYTDVLIELLHACGYQPLAMFAHVVRMDFEGDQWTFFKPPPADLEHLYGIDVHEMNPYRPLPVQIAEQLQRGRAMIVDLDSFYLPELSATSYRRQHVKTACAVDLIDPEHERLHYFHGPGFFALEGDDYRGVMRINPDYPAEAMTPYVDLVRFDSGPRPETEDELREVALDTLRHHMRLRPAESPVRSFGTALSDSLPALIAGDLAIYHGYAFATVRILGSGFEALGDFIRWLFGPGPSIAGVEEAIEQIVTGSKALSFRMARRREFDPTPLIDSLADAYERVMSGVEELAA